MKINNINTIKRTSFTYSNRTPKTKNHALHKKNAGDIICLDNINFKSNVNTRQIDCFVGDKKLKERIIKNIITDSKGQYREDIERLYINMSEAVFQLLTANLDSQSKNSLRPSIQQAAAEVFESIKDNDKFDLAQNIENFAILTQQASINILNNISDNVEILKVSKQNKKINPELFSKISNIKIYTESNKDIKTIKAILERYSKDNKGKFAEHSTDIFILTELVNSPYFDDIDKIYGLVLDKNKNLDKFKYNFVFYALQMLDAVTKADISKNTEAMFFRDIEKMKAGIIDTIQKNCTDENGNLDIIKAKNMLLDWIDYVHDYKYQLNNDIEIQSYNIKTKTNSTVKLGDIIGLKSEFTDFYDSDIYRLYCLLK